MAEAMPEVGGCPPQAPVHGGECGRSQKVKGFLFPPELLSTGSKATPCPLFPSWEGCSSLHAVGSNLYFVQITRGAGSHGRWPLPSRGRDAQWLLQESSLSAPDAAVWFKFYGLI